MSYYNAAKTAAADADKVRTTAATAAKESKDAADKGDADLTRTKRNDAETAADTAEKKLQTVRDELKQY